MNQLKITPSLLNGHINAISSKSLSHRYVIAASFAKGLSQISNVLDSEDLEATIDVLKNMNIDIKEENDIYYIQGNTFKNTNRILDANESGSTLRFFIPIAWNLQGYSKFTGTSTLGKRSISVYEDISKKFDYTIDKSKDNFPIIVKGPIKPGSYKIDGSISSQFVSGLLFVLPQLEGSSTITFTKELASRSYVDLTINVLKEAGIVIKEIDNGYYIQGNQEYKALNAIVEGDYSQASFFLIAGLLNGSIKVDNLNINSLQGDKEVINIIRKAKGNIRIDNSFIETTKSKLISSVIDLYNIPDLAPILMVMASQSEGVTTFLNVDRLIDKESNRLLAMKDNLEKMGVSFIIDNNKAYITGVDQLIGGFVAKTYNDHRIAMAMTIASSIATAPVILDDYTVVNKSYPKFFEDFKNVGGLINEIR